MVHGDQHHEHWTKITETSGVPGDSLYSQSVEQSRREGIIQHGMEVEQQDPETSLRRVWHTRKRLSERERGEGRLESTAPLRLTVFQSEHNCCGRGDEAIQ